MGSKLSIFKRSNAETEHKNSSVDQKKEESTEPTTDPTTDPKCCNSEKSAIEKTESNEVHKCSCDPCKCDPCNCGNQLNKDQMFVSCESPKESQVIKVDIVAEDDPQKGVTTESTAQENKSSDSPMVDNQKEDTHQSKKCQCNPCNCDPCNCGSEQESVNDTNDRLTEESKTEEAAQPSEHVVTGNESNEESNPEVVEQPKLVANENNESLPQESNQGLAENSEPSVITENHESTHHESNQEVANQ